VVGLARRWERSDRAAPIAFRWPIVARCMRDSRSRGLFARFWAAVVPGGER
jgi:hypothetical protein